MANGKFNRVLITMAIALLVVICGKAGWAAEEVKVGALFPLSGPLSDGGTHTFYGVKIATEMYNERGGWNGKRIKLVVADAVDVKTGRSEAERLITVEGVKFIIGTYGSQIAFATTEVAERHRAFYWETIAVADAITERGFKYTFRPNCKGSQGGELAAQYFRDELPRKLGMNPKEMRIAVVYEDSIWGTTAATSFINLAKEAGLNLVETVYYKNPATDLSSVVLRVKDSRADVIYMTSYLPDGTLFIKQSKQLGLRPKAIFTYGIFNDPPVYEALGNDTENLFCFSWPIGGIDASVLPKRDQADYNEFIKRYKLQYKEQRVHQFSFGGYAGAKVLYDHVLSKVSTLEAPALRAAALSIDIPTPGTAYGYGVKFAENGENLRTFFVLWQWQGGDVYIVYPDKLATRKPIFKPPFTK